MMNDAAELYRLKLDKIQKAAPSMPFISNVTGKPITNQQATSTQYWVDQLLKPVQFNLAISTLLEKPDCCFISNKYFQIYVQT